MANVMQSAKFAGVVEPVFNQTFDGIYKMRKDEYKQVFDDKTDVPPRSYFEEVVLSGLGAAPELPEGTPIVYQSGGTLFIARFEYKVWGLAFAITEVLQEDGDHITIGKIYSQHLARAMIETNETNTAQVLNRSFNTAYTQNPGDGQPLISASHPIANGTFSNQLTTAANLSQTSVEQLLIQIRRDAVDNNNRKINLTPLKLTVPPAQMMQAERIRKSVLTTGTANNDINPVKSMGLLDGETAVISRLTSNTAWWVKTEDAGRGTGLCLFIRRPVRNGMEGDFSTGNMRYKATMRNIPGWVDPRVLYGTAGV